MSILSRVLHNGKILDSSEAILRAGQLGVLSGWGVFSTIYAKDGALFAYDRHWARMSRDAAALNVEMPASADDLERDLLRLVEAAGRKTAVIRVCVIRNSPGIWEGPGSGRQSDIVAMLTDVKTWSKSVNLAIQPNGRFAAGEFSGAKVLSWAHNLTWTERAQQAGFDEVILLNEHGRVSECTSANIFAVYGNEVFTPPLSEGCLPGVTREVLLNEIHVPGVTVSERVLTPEDLCGADAVFITSTTRILLPVRAVAGHDLKGFVWTPESAPQKLHAAFNTYIDLDIAQRTRTMATA